MIQILSISTIAVDGNPIFYYPPSLRHCEERSDVAASFSATHALFLYLCILIYLFIVFFFLSWNLSLRTCQRQVWQSHTLSPTSTSYLMYLHSCLLSLRVGFSLRSNLIHYRPHSFLCICLLTKN